MPDGTTTFEVNVFNGSTIISQCTATVSDSSQLYLTTVQPDGTFSSQVLDSTSVNGTYSCLEPGAVDHFPGSVIPDGQGGLLASWTRWSQSGSGQGTTYMMSHISNGSTISYAVPYNIISYFNGPTPAEYLVLGDNGIVFAVDNSLSIAGEPVILAFDMNSGAVEWTYQQPVDSFTLIAASDGGGLVAKSTTNGVDTVLRFDSSGNVTPDPWTASVITNFGGTFWQGVATSSSPASGFNAVPVALSGSPWNGPNGTGGGNAKQDFSVPGFSQTGPNQAAIMGIVNELLTALPIATFPGSTFCYNWLQSGGEGKDALPALQYLTNSQPVGWGHGVVMVNGNTTYTTMAFSGNQNPDKSPVAGVPDGVVTVVNDSGGFFNSNYSLVSPYNPGQPYYIGIQGYLGGTLRAQAEILLHEMGHSVIGENSPPKTSFQNDLGDPQAELANEKQVDTNCRAMIEALPSITKLSPTSGPVGISVTITGTNLGASQGTSTVTFGGIQATPTSWTIDSHMVTTIVVPVPSNATTGNVVVTVSGVPTSGPTFTVQ
jgi:hypothetical protein